MNKEKPTWNEYFISIARVVATRSNCVSEQKGAILVKDKQIISTGYCGTPKGYKDCCDGGCGRCNMPHNSGEKLDECLCCHAEENAIVQAAYNGVSTKDSEMYTTHLPCLHCAKIIINAGIQRVYFENNYPISIIHWESSMPKQLLNNSGVAIWKIINNS